METIDSGVSVLADIAAETTLPKMVSSYVKKVVKDIETSLDDKIIQQSQQLKTSKPTTEESKVLTDKIDLYTKQKEKVKSVYKSLK